MIAIYTLSMNNSDKQVKTNASSGEFSKKLSPYEIIVGVVSRKWDTLVVRRIDSNEDQVFDLTKEVESKTMSELITIGADQLLGWKTEMRHKEDHEMAMAVDLSVNSKTSNDGAFAASFHLPPDNKVPIKSEFGGFSPGKKKGQSNDIFNVDDDSDEDTGEVWKPSQNKMMQKYKKPMGEKNGISWYCSYPFKHIHSDAVDLFVTMDLPFDAWFIRADQITCLFSLKADDQNKDMPFWQKSFKEVPIRKQAHGANEYKRRSKGKGNSAGRTVNKITFVLRYHASQLKLTDNILQMAIGKITNFFKRKANPGHHTFLFLKENAPGIIEHFKKQFSDDTKLIKYLDDTLVDVFSREKFLAEGTPLDRFYMDYTIKEFLQATGVRTWNDVKDWERVYKDTEVKDLKPFKNIEHKPFDE